MQRTASFLTLGLFLAARAAHAGPQEAPIVGGTNVEPGAFPDVVAVLGADGSMCSGTLIDSDLVLTAGHCIEIDPIEVITGSVDLARPGGEHWRVKWTRAYPNWEQRYDVGIIMLEHPVFERPRAIVQGCTKSDLKVGVPLQVVGFGLTTKSGIGDNTRLHQATVPLVDARCEGDAACEPSIAPGGELIAGGKGTDACFGDSGGPLYIATAKGLALIGVVSRATASWGQPCGEGGIYVRADKVVAWIESVSERKLTRAACDSPADAPGEGGDEGGGCNAGGVEQGFALYYAALLVLGLRRARGRRHTARS